MTNFMAGPCLKHWEWVEKKILGENQGTPKLSLTGTLNCIHNYNKKYVLH